MVTQVLIKVDEVAADAETLEMLGDTLRSEILELDVADVVGARGGAPPPGSRSIDVATAGALLVSIGGSVELVGRLVNLVRSWLARNRGNTARTVDLTVGNKTLHLTEVSSEQQERLVEEFIGSLEGDMR